MLSWRLGVSAVLIPVLVLICIADYRAGDQGVYLLGLCLLLAARAAWEMAALLGNRIKVDFICVLPLTLIVVVAGWVPHWIMSERPLLLFAELGPPMLGFVFAVLCLFLKGAIRYREPGSSMETLGAEVLIVAYVGVLLTITAQLRWLGGYAALASLIIAAKSGDVGAYTLGRLFGRKKMVPRLSPGKTWMGALGALIGAGAASWAWFQFGAPNLFPKTSACDWYWSVLFGIIIGLVGLGGDLCESLIKRDVEQKDSAELLPGFGGLLDLLDSILYAGPVAYVLWIVLPLG
jgi:phosphatidate cytidylyltransferase